MSAHRTLQLLGLFLLLPPIALWVASGFSLFTYFPDPRIDQMNCQQTLESALNLQPTPALDNTFRLGLLPSPALGREALSVLVLMTPSTLLFLLSILLRARAGIAGARNQAVPRPFSQRTI